MYPLVFNAHEKDPHVVVPVLNPVDARSIDDIYQDMFDLLSVGPSVLNRGPFVVALVEVVPVHLVDSDSEHGFVFSIHPLFDDAIVEAFVDVDCCCVSVVENKGVPQGLGTNKVDLVVGQHLEQLLIDGVGF